MSPQHPQDSEYPAMKAAKKLQQQDQEQATLVKAFKTMIDQHINRLEQQCA